MNRFFVLRLMCLALSALLGSLLIEPMFRPYMIGEEGDKREG